MWLCSKHDSERISRNTLLLIFSLFIIAISPWFLLEDISSLPPQQAKIAAMFR